SRIPVPNLDGAVFAGCQYAPTVGTEHHRLDCRRMVEKWLKLFPAGHVPQPQTTVLAARRQGLTVRAERYLPAGLLVAYERVQEFPASRVPDVDVPIVSSRGQVPAIPAVD